jgi:hypothetical protein
MNLKEIAKNLRSEAKKLDSGTGQEKAFGQELSAIADKIDRYREANERPLTTESMKQVRVGNPKFKPRRL